MTVEELATEANWLPLEDRTDLVRRLEAGLVEAGWEKVPELSERTKAELDLRMAEYEADPNGGSSWADVVAGLKRRRQTRAACVDALARLGRPSAPAGRGSSRSRRSPRTNAKPSAGRAC